MARPKADINWSTVEKLCAIHCTGEEIAAVVGVHYDTLQRRIKEEFDESFTDYYKKKSAMGSMSLRRKQHEVAMSGNTTMLIWLGKQYLGQLDRPLDDIEDASKAQPVTVNIEVKDARKPES